MTFQICRDVIRQTSILKQGAFFVDKIQHQFNKREITRYFISCTLQNER